MVAEFWRWPQLRNCTFCVSSRAFSTSDAECGRWSHLFSGPSGHVSAIAAELRRLGESRSLADGRHLHGCIRARTLDMYTFVGNCLIDMYANCGSLEDALHAFDRLPNPNVYSWNMLIKAHCKSGSVPAAFNVFSSMPLKDCVSWNMMISAFAQHGHSTKALYLFNKMMEERFSPNKISFVSALDACAKSVNLYWGYKIHGFIVGLGYDGDVLIGTALLNAYSKCKKLQDAFNAFSTIQNHDIISYNAMICALSQTNSRKQALHLFLQMLMDGFLPDSVSFISVLEGCALEDGQILHSFILETCGVQDVEVGTALFTMYGRSGNLQDAWDVFLLMGFRTLVVWNAMIAALTHNNKGADALTLYQRMRLEGFEPDKATFTSILDACAGQAALEEAQKIHAVISCDHDKDTLLCNALISLYAECGNINDASRVFRRMECRDAISWTALINGSVQNGHHNKALHLFQRMQSEGFKPDNVTYVSVLVACGRSGWLDEGKHLFVSINQDDGLCICVEHYLCLIYLLGQAGQLDVAEKLIDFIPSGKVAMAWLSLLGSCKIHEDTKRGRKAAAICERLAPENVVPYVMLSNIITASRLREDIG